MRSVYSSHAERIGYSAELSQLTVKYRDAKRKSGGRVTIYEGVPPEVAQQVMGAASIGQALHLYIRGHYKHYYLEDEE